jgi:hypothetical protein
MTPVTARRRRPHRVDARRHQGAGRGPSALPSLFDAAPAVPSTPTAPTARVEFDDSGAGDPSTARIEVGEREATVASGSGETLDRLVVSSWERLVSHADAPCLLCGGTMEPRYGAHAAPIGGRCRDCGTTLG